METAKEKLSATIDRDIADEIRKYVGPRGVSSFLNEAARAKLQRERIIEYLAELDEERGRPIDEDIQRAARAAVAEVIEFD